MNRLRIAIASLVATALLVCAPPARGLAKAPPGETLARKLVFAVVVSRQSVRSPLHEPPAYRWPSWSGVVDSAPGDVTAHGYVVAERMGEFYASYFHEQGLDATCYPPTLYVWADLEQPAMATAYGVMNGWCGMNTVQVQHVPNGRDPLFHSKHPFERGARLNFGATARAYAPSYAALDVLLRARCAKKPCANVARTEAGLDEASTLAENLFLEYAECRAEPQEFVAKVHEAMRLHVLAAALNDRTAHNAMVGSANLLAHIVAALDEQAGRPHPRAASPDVAGDTALLLAGHGMNLASLGGLLGVHWDLGPEYQRDEVPPASALVFELYRSGNAYSVQVQFVAPTLAQLRNIRPQTRIAHVVPVATFSLDELEARAYASDHLPFVQTAWPADTSDPVPYPPMTDPSWAHCTG